MLKLNRFLVTFIVFSCFGMSVLAQNNTRKQDTDKSNLQSDLLILEKFNPPTTLVTVKNSKKLKIPTVFLLETPSGYRACTDPSFYKITNKWFVDHPNSLVIEVFSIPIFPNKQIEYGKQSYVWVVDGADNLNIELVQKGACEAKSMLLDDETEKDILIESNRYIEFKRRILEAEQKAREIGLGIWKTKVQNRL